MTASLTVVLFSLEAADQFVAQRDVVVPALRVDAQVAPDRSRVEHEHGRRVLVGRSRQHAVSVRIDVDRPVARVVGVQQRQVGHPVRFVRLSLDPDLVEEVALLQIRLDPLIRVVDRWQPCASVLRDVICASNMYMYNIKCQRRL